MTEKAHALMEIIRLAWTGRLASVMVGAKAAERQHPGTGKAYSEGYRAGYWDGVNDATKALAVLDGTARKVPLMMEAEA